VNGVLVQAVAYQANANPVLALKHALATKVAGHTASWNKNVDVTVDCGLAAVAPARPTAGVEVDRLAARMSSNRAADFRQK